MSEPWSRISLEQGDITTLDVDAIVNAANERLSGGGGVDGAIHRAAGSADLQAACRQLGGCPTGQAVVTPGFALPARWIVHTVGPIYLNGDATCPKLLASCYRRSLEVAAEKQCRSIAFPAISTGVYGYPFRDATRVALETVAATLPDHPGLQQVRLVFFSADDLSAAQDILRTVRSG